MSLHVEEVSATTSLTQRGWGTKGLKKVQFGVNNNLNQAEKEYLFSRFRRAVLGVYILGNGIVMVLCLTSSLSLNMFVGKLLVLWSCFVAIAAFGGLFWDRLNRSIVSGGLRKIYTTIFRGSKGASNG